MPHTAFPANGGPAIVGDTLMVSVKGPEFCAGTRKRGMKQLVPTGLEEFLAEHAAGDAVTGRVVSMDRGVAHIELGEAIVALFTLPNEANALDAPATEPTSSGTTDLSVFSSMLKSKWKFGHCLSGLTAKPEPKNCEPVNVGQVRNFRIKRIDVSESTLNWNWRNRPMELSVGCTNDFRPIPVE
jgi:small subunit ribosomal protein S1